MKYTGTATAVSDQTKAIEILELYPLKPSHIGLAMVSMVPQSYSPGALGWTDKLAAANDVGGGLFECDIPDALATKHDGKSVVVDGKTVVVAVKTTQPQDPKTTTPGVK
jgi:hypothetical protein